MGNYSELKDLINNPTSHGLPAWDNGDNKIEGEMMKSYLLAIVNSLSAGGYLYAGVAKLTPTQTNPGSPDANVFYIATEPGTYTNFVGTGGSLVVADGEVAIFKWNGTWSKEVTGAATAAKVTELGQEDDGVKLLLGFTKTYSYWNIGYSNDVGIRLYNGYTYTFKTSSGVLNIYAVKADGTAVSIGQAGQYTELSFTADDDYVAIRMYIGGAVSLIVNCSDNIDAELNKKTDKKFTTNIIWGAYLDSNAELAENGDWFVSPLIRLSGETLIVWYYKTYNISGKLAIYNANLQRIGGANPVSGESRTITLPEGASYVRASFLCANKEVVYLADGDGKILWKYKQQDGLNANDVNRLIASQTIGKIAEIVTPFYSSRRLNTDGTSTGYTGYTCTRFLRVKKGDIIHYHGIVDDNYMIPAAGYATREIANATELFSANTSPIAKDLYFVIANSQTKYVLLCSHSTTELSCEIIPYNGYINNNIEKASYNIFPNALSKAQNFVSKYLSGDDVQICLLGDSITQISNQSANANPESLPPFMERKNWCYRLWEMMNKPDNIIYRRNDYPDFFTKVGTWSEPTDADNSFNNSISSDTNAEFSFDWDLSAYEKTNLVMPINGAQSRNIKVEILFGGSGANNMVEYYDASSKQWIEANGLQMVFLRLTGNTGELLGCNNNRYKFRRKSGANGTITFRVYKSTEDTDGISFWGVEQWNGQAVFISNAAYGGYATYQLQPGNISNIAKRYPDLVLFELTLVNNYGDRYSETNAKSLMENDFLDYIWGDRQGSENTLSLKSVSNDWQDFELVCIIPHWRKQWVDGNNFRSLINNVSVSANALECYNIVKKLFFTKNDVEFIDVGGAMKHEAFKRGWTLEQSYDGDEHSDITSMTTFCQDTVHLNDLGSQIYGLYIAPIFDF